MEVVPNFVLLCVFHAVFYVNEAKVCKRTKTGSEFKGNLAVTVNGRTCQKWSSQTPHKHKFTNADHFPEGTLEAAANYCRNPDGDIRGPWCFTTSPEVQWEFCDVPTCDKVDCRYTATGREYMGNLNVAKSGLNCLMWKDNLKRNNHVIDFKEFPDKSVKSALNHCRNPNGDTGGPWCFVKGKKNWEYCDIQLCTLKEECKYSPTGKEYTEQRSFTKEGFICQKWSTQYPNRHKLTDNSFFPDGSVVASENYCRNPDNMEGGPWCYTKNGPRWQYCDIKLCKKADCVESRLGTEYKGTLSVTKSGKRCRRWDTTRYSTYRFPDNSAYDAHNYCRNPDRDERGLWCVLAESSGAEYCHLPRCAKKHPKGCSGVYRFRYGSKCIALMKRKITYSGARWQCAMFGGRLLTIENYGMQQYVNKAILNYADPNTHNWLIDGFRYDNEFEGWNGQKLPYSYWDWRYSKHADNKRCIYLHTWYSSRHQWTYGRWYAGKSWLAYDGYICGARVGADGGWSAWQITEQCSVTCGDGRMTKRRKCNNPSPSGLGKNCIGHAIQREPCSTFNCYSKYDKGIDPPSTCAIPFADDKYIYYGCALTKKDEQLMCPSTKRLNSVTKWVPCEGHIELTSCVPEQLDITCGAQEEIYITEVTSLENTGRCGSESITSDHSRVKRTLLISAAVNETKDDELRYKREKVPCRVVPKPRSAPMTDAKVTDEVKRRCNRRQKCRYFFDSQNVEHIIANHVATVVRYQCTKVLERRQDECIFPFRYSNQDWFKCLVTHNEEKPWCGSTYDTDRQPYNVAICSEKNIQTFGVTELLLSCVKRFRYYSKMESGCITKWKQVDERSKIQIPWCATTDDWDRDRQWKRCDKIV